MAKNRNVRSRLLIYTNSFLRYLLSQLPGVPAAITPTLGIFFMMPSYGMAAQDTQLITTSS